MHYVKFQLSPGQQPPSGSLGVMIPDTNWIVWAGEDGSQFPSPTLLHENMTAEEIAAVQPAALCVFSSKRLLESLLDGQQALIRAVALSALAEINALRSWIASFKLDVAAAASLADLKSRVANLPAVPNRTKKQLFAAIVGKLDSGETTT